MKAEAEALGGTVHLYPTDLSDPAACKQMLESVIAKHGRVDVLADQRAGATSPAGRSIQKHGVPVRQVGGVRDGQLTDFNDSPTSGKSIAPYRSGQLSQPRPTAAPFP